MTPRIKSGLADILHRSGLLRAAETVLNPGNIIVALHRVLPAEEMPECYNPHLAITPESFEAFLVWLRSQCAVVSLSELLSHVQSRKAGRVCAVTFDDGWEDNFRFAFPILQKQRVPATIFLATGLVGSDALLPEERLWRVWQAAVKQGKLADIFQAFDAADALSYTEVQSRFKRLPMRQKTELIGGLEDRLAPDRPPRPSFMSWEQVQAMKAAGIEFGTHSVRHTTLGVEDEAVIKQELTDSLAGLRAHAEMPHAYLAYPNGSYHDRVITLAQEAGYEAACTTRRGKVDAPFDPFTLPRVPIDNLVVNSHGGNFSAARARLHLLRESRSSQHQREY